MTMKKFRFAAVFAGVIALAGWNVFGLGSDYSNGQPANKDNAVLI